MDPSMMRGDAVARDAIQKRLAESRAEICRLLEPPPEDAAAALWAPHGAQGGFPRSRAMRKLMSGPGLGVVGAVAAGLLLARPKLAWRLIRLLPTSALARSFLLRLISSLRPPHD